MSQLAEHRISIELLVPTTLDASIYRARAARRAKELGWTKPQSKGLSFANPEYAVATLTWTLPGDTPVAEVITALHSEFHLAKVIGAKFPTSDNKEMRTCSVSNWSPALLPGELVATDTPTLLAGQGQLAANAVRIKRAYRVVGCASVGCPAPHFAHGLCQAHWRRYLRTGQTGVGPPRAYGRGGCVIVGCPNPHHAHGWCRMHLDLQRRHPPVLVGAGSLSALIEAFVDLRFALVTWQEERKGAHTLAMARPKYFITREEGVAAAPTDGSPWNVVDVTTRVGSAHRRAEITDASILRMRRLAGEVLPAPGAVVPPPRHTPNGRTSGSAAMRRTNSPPLSHPWRESIT